MSELQGMLRRRTRVRTKLRKSSTGRPRLSIFRSNKYIYAQVVDDAEGKTIAAASTLEKDMRAKLKKTCDMKAAEAIGKTIAERAVKAGVKQVAFDRGSYLYHGRVKALADAARSGGLKF